MEMQHRLSDLLEQFSTHDAALARVAELEDHVLNLIYAFDSLDKRLKGKRVVNLDERYAAVDSSRKSVESAPWT